MTTHYQIFTSNAVILSLLLKISLRKLDIYSMKFLSSKIAFYFCKSTTPLVQNLTHPLHRMMLSCLLLMVQLGHVEQVAETRNVYFIAFLLPLDDHQRYCFNRCLSKSDALAPLLLSSG